jgi:hypothetical protein
MTHLNIQGEGENSEVRPHLRRRQVMTKFRIFSAAALLSLAFATPVFAQAAIQEPGAFAFYYPNNDVLNGGRPTPAAGPNALTPEIFGSGGPLMNSNANGSSCERYRSFDPASGTILGHDGRRHVCR